MKFLSYLIPFSYVRNFRYYQGKKIYSYFFGELLQQYLFCYLYLCEIENIKFILLLFIFWSTYEIGYITNDCISIHFENIPTNRAPKHICDNAHYLIISRLIVVVVLFYVIITFYPIVSGKQIIIFITATISVFTIHNLLRSYKFRIITFIVLGLIRQGFIIGLMGAETSIYFLIVFPYILIKLFGYLHAKQIISEDFREDLFFRFVVYLFWGAVLPIFIFQKFMFIYFVLFGNQNKKFFHNQIYRLIRR
jgi:hypothetical protein